MNLRVEPDPHRRDIQWCWLPNFLGRPTLAWRVRGAALDRTPTFGVWKMLHRRDKNGLFEITPERAALWIDLELNPTHE